MSSHMYKGWVFPGNRSLWSKRQPSLPDPAYSRNLTFNSRKQDAQECRSRIRRHRLIQPRAKASHVTQPLQITVDQQLSPLGSTNTPLWSTFCGLTNGVWRGKVSAFFPGTELRVCAGEPETVYIDGKKPVLDVNSLVVEDRIEDDEVLRRILRSPSLAEIEAASLKSVENPQEEGWEEERIHENEEGLAFFDGGTFSRGPQRLLGSETDEKSSSSLPSRSADDVKKAFEEKSDSNGVQPDLDDSIPAQPDWGEDNREKRKVSTIEQCLAWGGEKRLRLVLTISVGVGEGELDVQILRLVMFLESWQGLAEGCEIDKCIDENTTATQEVEISFSQGPRTGPEILKGVWKSYDISAVPVNDRDPLTGEMSSSMLYFNQERRETWSPSTDEQDEGGAALWLPYKTLVDIQMIRASSRGRAGDKEENMTTSPAAGVLFSLSWLVNPQTVIGVHREYDGAGELLECRTRTSVSGGGWVGGSM